MLLSLKMRLGWCAGFTVSRHTSLLESVFIQQLRSGNKKEKSL